MSFSFGSDGYAGFCYGGNAFGSGGGTGRGGLLAIIP